MLILKQHGVHDATPGWAALSAAAQESLHHAYIRQTAATHPKALRELLQLGFPLVGSCAALGLCKIKATKHVLETSVIRLLDETTPLWAPSAEFRGRVTQLLRSGRYISEDSAADKAKQQKQQTRQLLAAMQEAHVRDGTRSWSGKILNRFSERPACSCHSRNAVCSKEWASAGFVPPLGRLRFCRFFSATQIASRTAA